MDLELFVTAGLGDNSYLLASGDEAVLVDPQRDAWRFLRKADERGWRVRYVLETHVHNDYVSGALEVRDATGAEILVPAGVDYAFGHRPMEEGADIAIGDLRVRAMHTPGHTPEHTSWVVERDGRPSGVFTGGSLIVGSAGRTDLLGQERAEELTRLQYRTMRRFAELPDDVEIFPTHGAGSFCVSAAPAMDRTTTVGKERTRNVALRNDDEEAFVRQQLSGLMAYPAYYAHMAPINRAGPPVRKEVPLPGPLGADDTAVRHQGGAVIVDARDRRAFAQAHIPGSVNVELTKVFAPYVGWVLPYESRLVLLVEDASTLGDAMTQLFRIGLDDHVDGYLDGGIEAWTTSGRPVRSYPAGDVDDLCEACMSDDDVRVLDVRQDGEWAEGHVPDSIHVFVGELPQRLDEIPRDRRLWVACASGMRSAIAASILDAEGADVALLADGGISEWLSRCYPRMREAG